MFISNLLSCKFIFCSFRFWKEGSLFTIFGGIKKNFLFLFLLPTVLPFSLSSTFIAKNLLHSIRSGHQPFPISGHVSISFLRTGSPMFYVFPVHPIRIYIYVIIILNISKILGMCLLLFYIWSICPKFHFPPLANCLGIYICRQFLAYFFPFIFISSAPLYFWDIFLYLFFFSILIPPSLPLFNVFPSVFPSPFRELATTAVSSANLMFFSSTPLTRIPTLDSAVVAFWNIRVLE